jgi:hypothetical protein
MTSTLNSAPRLQPVLCPVPDIRAPSLALVGQHSRSCLVPSLFRGLDELGIVWHADRRAQPREPINLRDELTI